MAGFAGSIGRSVDGAAKERLAGMLSSLKHHQEAEVFTYFNPDLGLSVGVVADQSGGRAPLWSESKHVCLILLGEVLSVDGTNYSVESDPSELLRLYETHGIGFLGMLNGITCGLLIDCRERSVVLFNDRYGVRRVSYAQIGEDFIFASEAKALLRASPKLRTLNHQSLGELISLGCVLQDRTLFSSVTLLPPASAWRFSSGHLVERTTFFDRENWECQPKLSESDYSDNLCDTWRRIIPRYFRGPEGVALSLTGGVDSRMIAAWLPPGQRIPCYTFGGRYRECADVTISRTVAERCQQPHHVIPVGSDFLSKFPQLAEKTVYLSDGTLDVSGAIDLYVQQVARTLAPVRITGTNGGEILRSIVAFKAMPIAKELFAPEFLGDIDRAGMTYAQELKCSRTLFTTFKQAPWYMASKFIVERSAINLRMPYFDNDLLNLVPRAPESATQSNRLSLQIVARGSPHLNGIPTDRGLKLGSEGSVLRLANFLQEFLFKAEYAYDYGMPQWLAKVDFLLRPLRLERVWLGRHKFHHFRVFYRDELSQYVAGVLLDRRALERPHVNRRAVEKIVHRHLAGYGNYTLELHKLLAAELIYRTLID